MQKLKRYKYGILGLSFILLSLIIQASLPHDDLTFLIIFILSIILLITINYEYIRLFKYTELLEKAVKEKK